jgi:hypothetical protein
LLILKVDDFPILKISLQSFGNDIAEIEDRINNIKKIKIIFKVLYLVNPEKLR